VKKISIITPCRNAERYIRETVESVIYQSAVLSKRVELEYVICDGNSTDQTISIIESYNNNSIKIFSKPDSGIYDALAKGLEHATGDIVGYINAGDYYNKHALDIVCDIFDAKKIRWLTGLNIIYNERSYVVTALLPFKYRKRFFDIGFYGKRLHFVQQESTFWSADLNKHVNYKNLARMKYAGDYYIWKEFSHITDLAIVEAYIGGFKIHRGQISENLEAYFEEVDSMTERSSFYDYPLYIFDKIIMYMPGKIKKMFNREFLFRFDHSIQEWV